MVTQQAFTKALDLEVIHPAEKRSMQIEVADICRPGIQFAGYFDVFANARPQVIGRTEMAYLMSLPEEVRLERLQRYFSYDIPCIVIANLTNSERILASVGFINDLIVVAVYPDKWCRV